jgi:hypothetical protein
MKMRRQFNRDQVLTSLQHTISNDEMRARLVGMHLPSLEDVLQWREHDIIFLKQCSPDLIFMLPPITSKDSMIELWCSEEVKGYWGKLETPRYWWFTEESDAQHFEKIWCSGLGPNRAWRRTHGL